jgi:hypothetical protein
MFTGDRFVDFPNLFAADDIVYQPNGVSPKRLYSGAQLRGAVPFPSVFAGLVPSEYLDRTNAQLMAAYGVAFAGEALDPATLESLPRLYGYARNW